MILTTSATYFTAGFALGAWLMVFIYLVSKRPNHKQTCLENMRQEIKKFKK